jgi:hypothetical protein
MSTIATGPTPRRIWFALTGVAVGLALASLVAPAFGYEALFALDREANVPTVFGAGLHLACAGVLGAIAYAHRGRRRMGHWAGLALLFAYLCLEELTRMHDRVGEAFRTLLQWDGPMHLPWLLPYGLVGVLLAALYARFVAELPAGTRRAFVAAAALFVGGAIGLEAVSAEVAILENGGNVGYLAVSHLEEVLEMSGTAAFLAALVGHVGAGGMGGDRAIA